LPGYQRAAARQRSHRHASGRGRPPQAPLGRRPGRGRPPQAPLGLHWRPGRRPGRGRPPQAPLGPPSGLRSLKDGPNGLRSLPITMLAVMGLHCPEISGRLSGHSSPPAYLKLSDMPNGLRSLPWHTATSAPPRDRDHTRSHRHAGGHGLHRPEISGRLPGCLSPPAYLKSGSDPGPDSGLAPRPLGRWHISYGANNAYQPSAMHVRCRPRQWQFISNRQVQVGSVSSSSTGGHRPRRELAAEIKQSILT
jgi:hypothetical protein